MERHNRNDGHLASKCKQCKQLYAIEARKNNPSRYLWESARCRARRRGVPFTITVGDVTIPTHCIVLGIPLDSRDRNHAPSLDEIVPGRGYVKGNVGVISGRANRIKSDATLADLQAVETYVRIRSDPRYGKWNPPLRW